MLNKSVKMKFLAQTPGLRKSWSLKTKQQGQPMRETRKSFKINHEQAIIFYKKLNNFFGEFDPGSGRTLAACLTHASRTENFSEFT
jgi:hypothetical protein